MTAPYSVSDYIHVLPETGSDERMHVLDDTCWCRPVLAARDAPGRRREYYLTHKQPPETLLSPAAPE